MKRSGWVWRTSRVARRRRWPSRALIAASAESWDDADHLIGRAMAIVEEHHLDQQVPQVLMFAVSAYVRAHRGDTSGRAPGRTARAPTAVAARITSASGWPSSHGVVLSRAELLLGDVEAARRARGRSSGPARTACGTPASSPGGSRRSRLDRLECAGRLGAQRRTAHHRRAAGAGVPADPSELPGDGRGPLRVAQHGQDPGDLDLPEARRVVARGRGRCGPASSASWTPEREDRNREFGIPPLGVRRVATYPTYTR